MKRILAFLVMAVMLMSFANADLSIQMKRTNPGIAGEKSAELIFDVVNTDFTHKVEGFIFCRTPDDAVISSALGASTGSGAQYVSPKFTMDVGPTQESMSLTLESSTAGDKRADCTFKYIPFKETVESVDDVTVDVDFEGSLTLEEQDISGFDVKLVSFTEGVEAVEAVEAVAAVEGVPAKAEISVDGEAKVLEVGVEGTIGALSITVNSATAEGAEVVIAGKKVTEGDTTSMKEYLKTNNEYVKVVQDSHYRELRLDKTVPFVVAGANADVKCPEGKSECKASEVDIHAGGPGGIPVWGYILGVLVIVLLIAYLLGKSSKKF